MAGMISLPSVFNMGGGIDLSKYRLRLYNVTTTITINKNGFLIGCATNSGEDDSEITILVDNDLSLNYLLKYYNDYDFKMGIYVGEDNSKSLINIGFNVYEQSEKGTFIKLFCPITFKNNLKVTSQGNNITLTVLEYIG